jgi:hypothetical protein
MKYALQSLFDDTGGNSGQLSVVSGQLSVVSYQFRGRGRMQKENNSRMSRHRLAEADH